MIGEFGALAAAMCFAAAAAIYKRPLMEMGAVSASILRFGLTGTLLFSLLALTGGLNLLTHFPPEASLLTVASGLVGLGAGDILYMTSFKRIGVAKTVSLVATYPFFSVLLGLAFNRAVFTIPVLLGSLGIFAGVCLLARAREDTTKPHAIRDQRIGIAAALTVAVLYSFAMMLVDMALDFLPASDFADAFAVNALRTFSAGAFLLSSSPAIDHGLKFLKVGRRSIASLTLGTLLAYGVGWYVLTISFTLAPSSSVVPLSSTTPLFATVASVLLLREPIAPATAAGTLLTVLGIFLLFIV